MAKAWLIATTLKNAKGESVLFEVLDPGSLWPQGFLLGLGPIPPDAGETDERLVKYH
jgi:uncharacterized protein YgfB (UPF0149 family)